MAPPLTWANPAPETVAQAPRGPLALVVVMLPLAGREKTVKPLV